MEMSLSGNFVDVIMLFKERDLSVLRREGSVCLILQETVKSCAILHQQCENSSCSIYSCHFCFGLVWFFAILIQ